MAGPKRLADEHPDKNVEIGDIRTVNGIKYRLYENQFGVTWNGGGKGGVVCCGDGGYFAASNEDPERSPSLTKLYKDFDKAADGAQKSQHTAYLKAKKVVDAYEA